MVRPSVDRSTSELVSSATPRNSALGIRIPRPFPHFWILDFIFDAPCPCTFLRKEVPDAQLEQGHKSLYGQARFPNNRPQRALGDLLVIRHREAAKWRRMLTENHVAARLVVKLVAELLQGGNQGLPRNAGQPAQRLTSTISSLMEGGTGSPCFFKLSRYPLIAS